MANCSTNSWADSIPAKICVANCQEGKFGENNTWTCDNTCTTGFGDNATHICLAHCPSTPSVTWGDISPKRMCYAQCFNDNFGENSTNLCKLKCETGFGENKSRICVSNCPAKTWADGAPRNLCVENCMEGEYGENSTWTCDATCTNGYGENISNICVDRCPSEPTVTWGDTIPNRVCYAKCFNNNYGENSTNLCQMQCNTGYQENISKICVSNCTANTWADIVPPRMCVANCKSGKFGENTTWTCDDNCTTGYGDNATHICKERCPSVPAVTWGDIAPTRLCYAQCFNNNFGENTTNLCQDKCNSGFAENKSRICVENCTAQTWADFLPNQICVANCKTGNWGENTT